MTTALPEPHDLDPIAQANARAKGKRPQFLADPAVERVLSITMAVATELAVARERIDTLERLLVQRGVLQPQDVEQFVPDAAAHAARDAWGREYIARILRILEQDMQAMAGDQASAPAGVAAPSAEPSIEQVMAELAATSETAKTAETAAMGGSDPKQNAPKEIGHV